MRKLLACTLMISTLIGYSQQNKNGTIYSEHPAITAVESMTKAWVEGESDKVVAFLVDELKTFNGTSTN